MFKLREYQQEAVDACVNTLNRTTRALLQAPTGAGKSVILGAILKQLGRRALVIVDREVLVRQLTATFTSMGLEVGLACSGVCNTVDTSKQITIGSRQTLSNNELPSVDLVVLDEAHLIPLKPTETQYGKLLDHYHDKRILGCTATPWRLDSGYIYGTKHRVDLEPWFDKLTYAIRFSTLQDQEHLAQLKGLVANYDPPNLESISITAGEYNLGELSNVMCKYVNVVNDTINTYLADHRYILVFATTIEHCEQLHRAIPNSGVLHSKSEALGEMPRVLISVNKLSIGFDFPEASALVIARPTLSSSLYLQMVGRVLRPHKNKPVAVLVDLTENTRQHCPKLDLDQVMVRVPKPKGDGIPPIKFCEAEIDGGMLCWAECHPSVMVCPECGARFPEKSIPKEYRPDLTAVKFTSTEPEWFDVAFMYTNLHISKKSGKKLLRIQLSTAGFTSMTASVWVCGREYEGFALKQGLKWWRQFTDEEMPERDMQDVKLNTPRRMKIKMGKYLEVEEVEF